VGEGGDRQDRGKFFPGGKRSTWGGKGREKGSGL